MRYYYHEHRSARRRWELPPAPVNRTRTRRPGREQVSRAVYHVGDALTGLALQEP